MAFRNEYDPFLDNLYAQNANRGQSAVALNTVRTPGAPVDPGMRYGQLGTMPIGGAPNPVVPPTGMAMAPVMDAAIGGFSPSPSPAIDAARGYGQNTNANYGQSQYAGQIPGVQPNRGGQQPLGGTRPTGPAAMTNGGYGQNANANYGQSAAHRGSEQAGRSYWNNNSQNSRPASNGARGGTAAIGRTNARRNPIQMGGSGSTL
jgi:hypothetical protein